MRWKITFTGNPNYENSYTAYEIQVADGVNPPMEGELFNISSKSDKGLYEVKSRLFSAYLTNDKDIICDCYWVIRLSKSQFSENP